MCVAVTIMKAMIAICVVRISTSHLPASLILGLSLHAVGTIAEIHIVRMQYFHIWARIWC